MQSYSFNPPRSGQIYSNEELRLTLSVKCVSFNPLDRVKFVQIQTSVNGVSVTSFEVFQSPRSGQICSNLKNSAFIDGEIEFQSPRSGQICSNIYYESTVLNTEQVSIP